MGKSSDNRNKQVTIKSRTLLEDRSEWNQTKQGKTASNINMFAEMYDRTGKEG